MRLKSFYAETMTEAMRMVRNTLGEDAVIVATREEDDGKTVRVTAAVEQRDYRDDAFGIPGFEQDSGSDWLQYDEEDEESAIVEKLTDVMLRHSVPEEITDRIISCAAVAGLKQPGATLVAALEHLFSFRPLIQEESSRAIMLVGPPGAGKTLGVAKLAANGVMDSLDVAVISTDTVRAGGVEQLSAFTKLMKIKLVRASDARDLKQALSNARNADRVFIDTGGMNPFDPEEMRDLARLIAAGNIEPVLVMPAGLDADESGEIARVYAPLGIRSMLCTRLDFSRRLGGLLSAAHYGELIFADASNTTQIANGLIPLSPKTFAQLLMPEMNREDVRKKKAEKEAAPKKRKVTAG